MINRVFSIQALLLFFRHGIMNRLENLCLIRKDIRMTSDEVWIQHWIEQRITEPDEDQEIANMNATDYAVLLAELEYK